MGIFSHHEGLVADFLSLATQIVRIEIAVVPDAAVATIAIIEGWTSGIELLHLIIHRFDIWTNSTFIAKTPENDTGVIEIALHQ